MSSKVDERVVSMKFNNADFAKRAADTTKSLADLKKGLDLSGAAKGLKSLDAAGKGFSLAHIGSGVDTIASKFSAMSIVGITALANIASRAVDVGIQMAKSFTIDPIKTGLQEYETQLNSVQTILANTQSSGATLKDVNATLAELNTYADQTIYNFAEMAKNIGTFTAAGVDLDKSTASIKGIANLAALSGSNSQQASTAMYQLSQAIASGRVSLQDWNSVVNAGMGGTTFQRALANTAVEMGTLDEKTVKLTGKMKNVTIEGKAFRDSIMAKPGKDSWLTSDVLVSTLAQFTGDLTDAELAAQGFNAEQIKAIQQTAATAKAAATEVKSATQLIDVLKEATGSGWAQTWQIIMGDFEEAKSTFTGLYKFFDPLVAGAADARNKLLEGWAEMGGRTALLDSVYNILNAVLGVLRPISEAFRQIFPPLTGKQLADMTIGFERFTAALIPSEETADKIGRTFKGVFAVLDIGWMIVKGLVGVFVDLFSSATEGAGGILDMTAGLGDWLVGVRDAIKNGTGLTTFFRVLTDILKKPIEFLRNLGEGFLNLGNILGDYINLESFAGAWENISNALRAVGQFLAPVGKWFVETFGTIKTAVQDAFAAADPALLVGILNAGAFGGVIIMVKKLVDTIKGAFGDIGSAASGGIIDTIKGSFESLTGTMEAMQAKLKSETLIKIAIAIGILTASVVALSFIETGRLYSVLGAMTIMFTQLMGSMVVLEKATGSVGLAKMPILSAALIGLATAMVIFSSAVLIMSSLDWNEMARGMTGMAVGLGLLVGASAVLSKLSRRLTIAAPAFMILATSMVLLASALKILSTMSWDDIGRGLAAFGGALAILVVAMSKMKSAVFGAASMLIVASAMAVLAGSMKIFSTMSWDDIGRSMTVLAGSLTILVVALQFMQSGLLGAASMVIVSAALVVLSGALKVFATMSWDDIGRALTVMAGGLAILAGAMALMGIPLVLLGSVGIITAAGAMMILAPALVLLGTMSWDAIGRGLTVLAGALGILAVGGLLLTPAIPAFLALGIAAGLIGVGALAAGVGMTAFAAGFGALAAVAATGSNSIKMALMTIVGLIPAAMAAFAQGLIDFASVIARGGTQLTKAFTTLMMSMLDAVNKVAPKIIDTLADLIDKMITRMSKDLPRWVDMGLKMVTGILEGIANNIGKVVTAGMNIIINFINGIAKNIGRVVTAATNVIVNFINGITKNQSRIIDAGVNMIISFVEGLARSIRQNTARMSAAGRELASAIIDGMTNGIGNGISTVVNAAREMASRALNAAKDFLGIRSPSREFVKIGEFVNAGFAKGITGSSDQVKAAYEQMKKLLKDAQTNAVEEIAKLDKKLVKLRDDRKEDAKKLKKAEGDLERARKKGNKSSIASAKERVRKLKKERADDLKDITAIKKEQTALRNENTKSKNAYTELTKNLADENKQLEKLAKDYQAKVDQVKKADEDLTNAKKTRDDYDNSIRDQYNKFTEISKETNLDTFVKSMQQQLEETREFSNVIQQLRGMGLNDDLYKELLGKGTDALPFATEILKGGQATLNQVNSLSSKMSEAAAKLGDAASSSLYQAAVDSAQGIVVGLKKERDAIATEMENIAEIMVTAMKKKLGIKSPSREFAKVGGWSAEGLVKGFQQSNKKVANAAEGMGQTALSMTQKTLAELKTAVATDMDMVPTIRPVLDLSAVRNGAGALNGMLGAQTLSVAQNAASAISLANSLAPREDTSVPTGPGYPGPTDRGITIIQTNNSPKALTPAEVYRQTKSAISTAKGAINSGK